MMEPDLIQLLASKHKSTISDVTKYRLLNMPMHKALWFTSPFDITQSDIGKLICLCCPVVRTSSVRNKEISQEFKCSDCGKSVIAKTILRAMNQYDLKPCTGTIQKENKFQHMINVITHKKDKDKDKEKGKGKEAQCKGNSFAAVENTIIYEDCQEIKIGKNNKFITVILKGNLTKTCSTGKDISVNGIVDFKINEQFKGKRPKLKF